MDEELEGIIQKMVDAGEPRESIILVIQEYQSRKGKETEEVAVAEEETAYPTDIHTGEPIAEYDPLTDRSWNPTFVENVKQKRIFEESKKEKNEETGKSKIDELKDLYVEKSKGVPGVVEGEIAPEFYGEWMVENAKLSDYDGSLKSRLDQISTTAFHTADDRQEFGSDYVTTEAKAAKKEEMQEAGYVEYIDGWIHPEVKKEWEARDRIPYGTYPTELRQNEQGVYVEQRTASSLADEEKRMSGAYGGGISTGFGATPVGLALQHWTPLVGEVWQKDPVAAGKTIPEGSKHFYGIVDEDNNLINFAEYFSKKGEEGRLTPGGEHEAILENNPGSYVIDDVEKLKKYADSNNLSYEEALGSIQKQGRNFSAFQEGIKTINYELDLEWYQDGGIDTKYLTRPNVSAKSAKVMDLVQRTNEALYDDKIGGDFDSDAPFVQTEKGKFAKSDEFVNSWNKIKDAKEKELKEIKAAKGKPNEEELIAAAKSKFNNTKNQSLENLNKGIKESFTPNEIRTAETLGVLNQSLDISDYGVNDLLAVDKDLGPVSQRDVGKAFLKYEKAMANGASVEELNGLWADFEDVWDQVDKMGAEAMWDKDFNYLRPGVEPTKEEKVENAKIFADALKFTGENAFENTRELRSLAYFQLKNKLNAVLQEGKVGDWGKIGLGDYLRPRNYQDLGNVDGPLPENLSIIPGDGTRAIIDFNSALREWKAVNLAYMMNLNPGTLEATGFISHTFGGVGDQLGFNERLDNDQIARSYAELATREGAPIDALGVKRMEKSWQENWGRSTGSILGFTATFLMNPLTKVKHLGMIGKNPFVKGGSYDKAVDAFKLGRSRISRVAIGSTAAATKGLITGVGYDKIMGGLVNQHQDFGPGMWTSVSFGGYFAGGLLKGLSMLPAKTATGTGAGVWKSFTNSATEVTKRLTSPMFKTPLRAELSRFGLGAGTSTIVMLGSELAVEKIKTGHLWEDVWKDIMNPITHRDFYTGEEVRMSTMEKVTHTFAMMGAGHLGHIDSYKNLQKAIEITGKNYQNRKSLPKDYEALSTTEKEANEHYNNGTEERYLLGLKQNALANLRMKKYGTVEGEITKEEMANIDRALDNVKESNTMKILKDMIIKNEAYDVDLSNVDRELFYLQNRLMSGLNKGVDYNLSFEDANTLAEIQPQYLGYLSFNMETSGKLNTPMASLLNSRIQEASHIMKSLRNLSSDKVWNNLTERKKAYNKVNEMLTMERELNTAKNRSKEEKGGLRDLSSMISDKEIENLEIKLDKVRAEVGNILEGAELQRKDIEYAQKLGEKLGIEPEIFESEAAYEAAMKEAGFKGAGTEAAFFYDKSSGRILINKARALRVEAFSAATHDMLHPLTDLKMKAISLGELSSMVKELKADDPLLTDIEAESIASTYLETHNREAKTFVKEFKNALSEKELEAVEERLDKNYRYIEESEIKDYNIEDLVTDKEGNPVIKDGKIELKEEAYQHEYPTALKDAITDNLIKYNESTAKKLGNVFKKAWKGIFPKAEWKSGEDVYEFVRTYAKGVQKGVIPLEVKRKAKEYKKSQKPEVSKMAASRTQEITKELKELVPEWKAAEGSEKVKLQEKMKTLTAEKKSLEQVTNRRIRDFQNISKRFNNLNSKGKEKIINELVEKDGERLTNEEWKEFLYTNLKDHGGEGLVLDKIAEMFESAIEGKIKGKVVTSNDRSVSRTEAMEMLRDELTSRKFQWEKILDFDPKINKSFSGYMNSIIHNAYKSTLEKIGKKPKTTKSIDETYEGGRRITEVESKELSPEELADISLAKEAKEKAKKLEEEKLIKEGATPRDIEKAAGRSTMKTTIDLTKTEQDVVKEFVESELKEEVKDLEKGDFSFFETPKFRNKAIKKFGKGFLERIPHPASENAKAEKKAIDELVTKKEITKDAAKELKQEVNKRLKNEYRTWLEKVLYPEIVDLNKPISEGGDPGIFRRMNWDILYEATGKKYSAAEAKEIQVEQDIKSITSQRAEYKEKTPTASDFADYIMHEGKYKNAKSRPNEKRLRIGNFLTEKIVGDAVIDVAAKSKNIPEFTKSEVLRQRVLSKMSEILKKDPSISLSKTAEILQKTPGSLLVNLKEIWGKKDKLTAENKKEIDKWSLEREKKYIEDLAKEHGIDPELMKEQILTLEKEGKEIAKALGLDYTSHKDKLGTERGIRMHKKFIKNTVTALEELGIDFNKTKDNKEFLSALHQMFGFGSLKIPSGRTDYLSIKDLLTEKEIDQGIKKISNLEAWRRFTGDNNLGKRKKSSKKLSEEDLKIQKAIKNFYFPEWGYGKRTAGESYGRGSKGLMDKITEALGPEALKMSKENRGDSDFVLESRDVYTAPHLRGEAEGLETTQAANRKVLEFVVKAMIKNYTKNPTKANLEVVMNALHTQVNASRGVVKGAVPMQSATAIHESVLEKTFDKAAHNEHMVELNEYTKDILNALDKYSKHKNKDFLNKQIEKIVNKLNQALISEKAQVRKDVSGKSIKDFHDIALNTFQTTSILKNQIRLGGKYRGWTEAEILLHEFGKNKIIKAIKSIPESKRSVEAVEMLQKLENESSFDKAFKHNEASLGSFSKTRKPKNIEEQVEAMSITDKALDLGKKLDKKPKKARVFDFDDTLAKTKSNVWYELPNGKKGKLTAEEFAKQSEQLTAEGAKFDFKEFSKVMEGEKGPLFELAKMIKESKGERDMFVLTARPPEAAKAIHEFLKELGLDIPIENIIGLGNGAPSAKAEWMVEKAAEGYNDFYFADDHIANVEAVQRAIDALPVKGKTQQAKPRPSFSMETKRDLKWDKKNRVAETSFKIKDKTYNIRLSEETKGIYELDFGLRSKKVEGSLGKVGITGTGNASEVLSIVSNGVLDFVKTNKVKEIVFSAIEPSRSRLYSTLTKFWANKLGWGHEADVMLDGSGFFKIGKDVKTIESFDSQSKPERKVLSTLDIKSKSQRASFSKTMDVEYNKILEQSSGVEWFKEFSPAKAEVKGKGKGKFKFFLPPSAEDFLGLVYGTLGKGKVGERQLEWYNKHLFQPYSRAMENLSTDRVNLMKDFKALKKQLDVPKDLRKITESGFTNEQAVRVYLWNKLGVEVPGLSKTDLKELNSLIESDSKLQAFGDQILDITKGDGYGKPGKEWLAGTITSDLISLLNTTKRGKYLAEWKQNADVIYSEKNLNKLEAIYGKKYREALENTLTRMGSGRNRIEGGNKLSNTVLNYINQSQGAIMFLNMRSATLQTISAANFTNLGFNNPLRMGKAFANQPQYWKDFVKIMKSDYLVDRRQGLKLNIAENEIADAAKTSTNKAKAALNYILEKGYAPTKFADSFAIASGGALFYRNRITDLMKRDPSMRLEEAERIAFKEFREISETSQQSANPSKLSQQQTGDLGRLTLQFVNTPMQYARLQKRSFQDLKNGRGDWKSNVSKILYYGVMQNLWFNFMQQGAFMMGFGDGIEDDEKEKRLFGVYNGMADSILRGIGLAGMTASVLKNLGIDVYERSQKDKPEYGDAWKELLGFSPSIKSKLSKFEQAAWPFDSKKRRAEIFEKGFSLDNPAFRSLAKVIEGATGLPLDRLYQKFENISVALDSETEAWQSTAHILGWPEWQLQSQKQKQEKKAKEDPSVYSKDEQIYILKQYGLTEDEIKDLKDEKRRVNTILDFQKSKNKVYRPPASIKKYTKLKNDTTKEQQEKMLLDLGYSKGEIKKLKYEDDRVNAIMDAKAGKKKKVKNQEYKVEYY